MKGKVSLLKHLMLQTRLAATIVLFLGLTGCSTDQSPSTLSPSASSPVTRLTKVEAQPVTTLQVEGSHKTTLAATQVGQTSTITVQQAITDLAAQKTSEGLLIVLPESILFDFDKSDIRPSAEPTLMKLAVLLKHNSQAPVAIYGHTDSLGDDTYNQTLSEKRANAVKNYLVQKLGIEAERLQTAGLGETRPVAPNVNPDGSDNPAGRQKNRRVEVIIRN